MTQKNSWVIDSDANQVTAYKKWFGTTAWVLGLLAVASNVGIALILYSIFNKHGFGGKFFTLLFLFGIVVVMINYIAAFYLFNSTELVLDKDRLMIKSSPVPSFDKVEIDSRSIDQLFVTQIEGAKIGSINNYYELKAKLKDGETQTLLSYTYQLSEDKAIELEQKIESLLNIPDEYVKGEYIEPVPTNFVKIQQKPKRVSMENSYIYNSNAEDWIFVKEHHQILHITQFDWTNGDTDKLYQTINEDDIEHLIYLDRNKGLLNIYQEKSIALAEVVHLNIDVDSSIPTFLFKETTYALDQIYEGNAFYDGQKGGTESKQLVYLSEDKKQMIRILFSATAPFYYSGIKLDASDLEEVDTDSLDLDAPIKEKTIGLSDRDFV